MRAREDEPSSPHESSRKGRAVAHSAQRTRTGSLHFLKLFALKGGSSTLHARFFPALPALQQTAQQETCLLHPSSQHPHFGDGARHGPPLPRALHEGASWLGGCSKLVCCPSARASRQVGQCSKDPSPTLGQTLPKSLKETQTSGQQLEMAVGSSACTSREISAPHTRPDQEAPRKAKLGQSTWCCRTWPANWLCPVTWAARVAPVATMATQSQAGEPWTSSRATCGSRRPGTIQHEHDSGSYLPAAKLPTARRGRGTGRALGSATAATNLCSAKGTTGPVSPSVTPCEAGSHV